MNYNKSLARGAMIAALYAAITLLLAPISYGEVQIRISESLTLLPVLLPEAVPALAVGCLIANVLGGCTIFDIVFGTLATLLAAAAIYPEDRDAYSYRMDMLDVYNIPDWKESAKRLQENACDQFTVTPDGFTAHIDAKEAGLLVFTVPYDKGFSAAVDGKTAEIIRCDVSFMAVWVEPGSHDVVFTYKTRSLNLGIMLSAAAAAVLLGYIVLAGKKRLVHA